MDDADKLSFPSAMPPAEREDFEALYWVSDMLCRPEGIEAINLMDVVVDASQADAVRLAAWEKVKVITGYVGPLPGEE